MATTISATMTPIASTIIPAKPPKKKVGLFQMIEPGQDPDQTPFPYPITGFRDKAVALVQCGSAWVKLLWDAEPTLAPGGSPAPLNQLATALMNQPSTVLLKGPVRLGHCKVYGDAYLHRRTVLMPFVRVREGISFEEADERIDRMLLGWGCVAQDDKGLFVVCAEESDLVSAKLAVR